MNRKILLFLLLFCVDYIHVIAQDESARHDSLLRVGLMMTRYDKDTSAEAVILSELGTVSIQRAGFYYEKYYRRSTTTKVLTQAGLSFGAVTILLWNNEKIIQLDAITYNLEDGKIVSTALDKKEMYEDKIGDYMRIERFAMPKVKVGSLVYVSYTIKSLDLGYFKWDFQQKIPVVYSQFNLFILPFFDYKVYKQNIDSNTCIEREWQDDVPQGKVFVDVNKGYGDLKQNVYSYVIKNISPFKDETFITSPEDYVIQIGFQLSKYPGLSGYHDTVSFLKSWSKFTNDLSIHPYFAGYFESKRGKLLDILDQLKIKGKPEAEKIKTIVNYVKANYRWNKAYSFFTGKEMKDFLVDKSGSSADINLFLLALLRAANIDTKPILLSTREHGKIKIKSHPFQNFFNDVICYVKTDSLTLLLDATEPLLPYYALPYECMNDYGFIVEKNDSSWVNLQPQVSATTMKSMLIKFSPNLDSVNCAFTIKASGYSGFNFRKNWDEGYEKFSSMLVPDKEIQIKDSIKVYSKDDLEEPFTVLYSASSPLNTQTADSSNLSQIIFAPFLNQAVLDNPLKMEKRKYPVDMEFKRYSKYKSMIVIPTGYKISEKPADIDYSIANGKATFSYKTKQISDNVIQVTSELSFNDPVFQPNEYNELKDFYDKIIIKNKELLILDKKL